MAKFCGICGAKIKGVDNERYDDFALYEFRMFRDRYEIPKAIPICRKCLVSFFQIDKYKGIMNPEALLFPDKRFTFFKHISQYNAEDHLPRYVYEKFKQRKMGLEYLSNNFKELPDHVSTKKIRAILNETEEEISVKEPAMNALGEYIKENDEYFKQKGGSYFLNSIYKGFKKGKYYAGHVYTENGLTFSTDGNLIFWIDGEYLGYAEKGLSIYINSGPKYTFEDALKVFKISRISKVGKQGQVTHKEQTVIMGGESKDKSFEGAVTGGILFGPAGAIAGAIIGKSDEKEPVREYKRTITNDMRHLIVKYQINEVCFDINVNVRHDLFDDCSKLNNSIKGYYKKK